MQRLLELVGNPPVTIRFWNGESIPTCDSPIACVLIQDRRTLWRLLLDPQYQIGEAFTEGRLQVEGDLIGFLTSIDSDGEPGLQGRGWHQRLLDWWHKPRGSSLKQSRDNIHTHYNLGNDFYRLWLDEQMLYTCAYFPTPNTGLEEAQAAKMDHICRKLRLEPGEEVIEAGCGWGALALHMAKHYDVKVRAFNISSEQIKYSREQAEEIGIGDRVEFIEDDWRNISGRCDKFVSVGMLEHVGLKNYSLLGRVIDRVLKPNGLGLIHSIGTNWPRPFDAWMERRIFPGAYPPALREMMDIFEVADFSILDVENIRLHYAQTIRHWYHRFENSVEEVRNMFDDEFVRAWRLYLAGSVAAFESGRLQLFQVLFSHGSNNTVPRTRDYQYSRNETSPADLFGAE
jgi:cyclopropane-fatty-acyl-phospholipid synthase